MWEDWSTILARLPAEPKPAPLELLREITSEMIALLERSLLLTGVVRIWDDEGQEYMYWQ